MDSQEFFLRHSSGAQLYYRKMGTGSKVLLAFHGFGQDHQAYFAMEEKLGDQYTLYSFDLFYHGKSFWHHNQTALTKEFWRELMLEFFRAHKIERYSLAGFSMGGRFVLSTLEAFPDRVEDIVFIAPDGIKTSTWYSLATYPGFFRNWFRSFIVKPQGFTNLVNVMHRYKVVDKGILKFANTQMRTVKQRRRVFYTWTVFKPLKFNMKRVAHLLNAYEIPVQMFLGKHDKIMTEENMRRLLNRLEKYELVILNTGHNDLIEETAKAMAGPALAAT